MSLKPLHPQRFDSDSAVAAYWFARCDGFRVMSGGRNAGVVEDAVFDWDPLDPVALRVRRSHGRTRLVLLTEVEAVEPLSRALYLRKGPARRRAAAEKLGRGTTRTLASTARMAARRAPVVRQALLVAARVVLALLVFLATIVLSALDFAARRLSALVRATVAHQQQRRALRARAVPPEPEPTSLEVT